MALVKVAANLPLVSIDPASTDVQYLAEMNPGSFQKHSHVAY